MCCKFTWCHPRCTQFVHVCVCVCPVYACMSVLAFMYLRLRCIWNDIYSKQIILYAGIRRTCYTSPSCSHQLHYPIHMHASKWVHVCVCVCLCECVCSQTTKTGYRRTVRCLFRHIKWLELMVNMQMSVECCWVWLGVYLHSGLSSIWSAWIIIENGRNTY